MKYALFLLVILLSATTRLPPSLAANQPCPTERYGAAMAYDEVNGRLILFGGSEWNAGLFYDDTWAYNYSSNEWAELNPPVRPPPRFNPGVAYIADQEVILIFGGYKPPERHLNDTWLFDVKTDTWRELKPSSSPTPRSNVGMAYDAKNRRVILFGGSSNSEYPYADTWAYDFESNSWTEMHPAAPPKPQYGVGMVYDSLNERVLLLEGHWVIRDESGRVRDGYDGGLHVRLRHRHVDGDRVLDPAWPLLVLDGVRFRPGADDSIRRHQVDRWTREHVRRGLGVRF